LGSTKPTPTQQMALGSLSGRVAGHGAGLGALVALLVLAYRTQWGGLPASFRVLSEPAPPMSATLPGTCLPPGAMRCAQPEVGQRTIAVYISGVKSRLLLNSTLERALVPLVRDGSAVHVYVSLLFDGTDIGSWMPVRAHATEDPSIAPLSHTDLQEYIVDRISRTGACVVCAEVLDKPEPIGEVPENPGQITKYPPRATKAGQRLLRLWKSRERMWHRSLASEAQSRTKYELFFWIRDDSIWLGDVPMPSKLLATPDAPRTVWARACGGFGGLNDKSVIFGRLAAPVLMTLYSGFMHGGLPTNTSNAEQYLLGVVHAAGMVAISPSFEAQPEASAMLFGSPQNLSLCAIGHYWCGQAISTYSQFLGFCEEVVPENSR